MSLQNYIEKLRAKPIRERERIAVIGTGIAFAFIFIIWIVSFKEMNKPIEQPVDQSSANLNDLKMNFQEGKDSIQDMIQQLPSQAQPLEEAGGAADIFVPAPVDSRENLNADNALQSPDDNSENAKDNNGVPQLP